MDPKDKYAGMQQSQYDEEASLWSIDSLDFVVGFFNEHNKWEDYDTYLFKDIVTKDKVALDFGCGPGRNIVKFSDRFERIDGVDISEQNLKNAQIWFSHNNLQMKPILYKNNGTDLSCITHDNYYDVVFSTIAMQHICVHETRFSLLKEFFRLLKPGGSICIQMGFGARVDSVGYFDNFYDATVTNSGCDTRIDNVNEVESDLNKIGYHNFTYDIRPVGPGDKHQNWIFFRAQKP